MTDTLITLEPLPLFIENEQKYISYILKNNPNDCIDFESKFFLDKNLSTIFKCIRRIVTQNMKLEIDILFDLISQRTRDIKKSDIELIRDSYTDFDNIKIVKNRIKENYLKQFATKGILNDVLTQTTDSGDLDIAKLKDHYNKMSDVILEVENDNYDLLTFSQIIETKYRKLLHDRNNGIGRRTLGLPYLDKYITYPAEGGDIMTIAMRKGGGKTVLGLNITNALINRNVPVVYFCLDMGYITVMDRFVCIVEGLSNTQILQEDKDELTVSRIESALKKLEKLNNFILYPEGSISLNDFESYVLKIKKIFNDRGIDSSYFVCVFDTIDMVEDFSGTDAYGIKKGINKLSTILKRNNIFAINLNQLNENEIRSHRPKKIEDVEKLRFTKESIEGGSAYAARSRVVLIGTRVREMKLSFFPEEQDLIDLEEDVLEIVIDKQNDGMTGRIRPKIIFDSQTFRLYPKGD